MYNGLTKFRNFLYNSLILKTFQTPVYSIGVGNLAVGGTGKTPFVSYLIQQFPGVQIAVLSRGYGRKTKGFLSVDKASSPATVGDEIFMLFEKHQAVSKFFVCEDRKLGVQNIMRLHPATELIIFDDIFQHRRVRPNLNILLSTFSSPFFDDFLMPYGRLRESRQGLKRADMLIFTKVQNGLSDWQRSHFMKSVKKVSDKGLPIFFTKQKTDKTININEKSLKSGEKVTVLSALARNDLFQSDVGKSFDVSEKFGFRDHHAYTIKDLQDIWHKASSLPVITTEKDFVKLKQLLSKEQLESFYVFKIEANFLEDEALFLTYIKEDFKRFRSRKGSLNNG
ncbi:MAG: tetraacyldisaccharide 4'-kinase [Algoriphagus sp.]|jgi:tetraacyldisaccharide 4'-kinase